MKKSQFFYTVPEELIAQVPLQQRDDSKLLIANANSKSIIDGSFKHLDKALKNLFQIKFDERILLIANDTRVYPARVRIQRQTGARGEVFLLETSNKNHYRCLLRPKSKLKKGEILFADSGAKSVPLFEIIQINPSLVRPLLPSLNQLLDQYGEMPLPPYIVRDPKRVHINVDLDKNRYQTVYCQENLAGSAAAPTAGLHFTPEVIAECLSNNIELCYVTLHVGLGTFAPVQTEDISKHDMHDEHYKIGTQTVNKICDYLKQGWPIVFVGTTALRAVESYFRLFFETHNRHTIQSMAFNATLHDVLYQQAEYWHSTRLFIYPKNEEDRQYPCIGHGIITNFHQPESTLAMLIASLIGYNFWKELYTHAIAKKYRFFSYGDSSLLKFKD